nr:hypothetical protein [Tanacetum cinerariifolium]
LALHHPAGAAATRLAAGIDSVPGRVGEACVGAGLALDRLERGADAGAQAQRGACDGARQDVLAERGAHGRGGIAVHQHHASAAGGQGFDRADRDVVLAAQGNDLLFGRLDVDCARHAASST